jgi:hypothetical protein
MTNEPSSTEQRMLKLLRRLHAKTAQGQVQWEGTAKEGMFQSSFPNYVVRISVDSRGEGSAPDYFLTIRNAAGRVVESTSDVAIDQGMNGPPQAFPLMKELHDMARRQALGVDKALDSLLSELE